MKPAAFLILAVADLEHGFDADDCSCCSRYDVLTVEFMRWEMHLGRLPEDRQPAQVSGGNCYRELATGKTCMADYDLPVGCECDWCQEYIILAQDADSAERYCGDDSASFASAMERLMAHCAPRHGEPHALF